MAALDTTFRQRWTDPRSVDTDNPLSKLKDRLRHIDISPDPLPEPPPVPDPAGSCAVQVLRTYPAIRPRTPYAPHGERTVARGFVKALQRARRLVYLQDQYLWSPHIARVLAAALRAEPDLHLVVVVPRHPDVDGRFALPPNEVGRVEAIWTCRDAAPDRVHVFDLENEHGTPVYVHAKVAVFDDVWARWAAPTSTDARGATTASSPRPSSTTAGRPAPRRSRRDAATAPACSPATCGWSSCASTSTAGRATTPISWTRTPRWRPWRLPRSASTVAPRRQARPATTGEVAQRTTPSGWRA